MTLKAMAGKLMKELALLTDDMIGGVVDLADVLLNNDEFVVAHLMSWFFLFRVQSECLILQVGTTDDFVGDLEEGVQSAVMVCMSELRGKPMETLMVRLARRKNRPTGSILKRYCGCVDVAMQKTLCHLQM